MTSLTLDHSVLLTLFVALFIAACDEIVCCDGSVVCNKDQCPPFTSSGNLEVCFALDKSGSVCTTASTPQACTNKGLSNTCAYNGKASKSDPDFCPKFNTDTKNFVRGFMQQMEATASSLGAHTKYAVATFSSKAEKDQDLDSASDTEKTLSRLEYAGGYTQTAEGMEACQELLEKGDPNADKLIVLVTDGRPRKDQNDPSSYWGTTKSYATNIKSGKEAKGGGKSKPAMRIMAVGVKSVESNLSFVQELGSPGLSVEVNEGYGALGEHMDSIVSNAVQSSCGTVSGKWKQSILCIFFPLSIYPLPSQCPHLPIPLVNQSQHLTLRLNHL